ncbi:MAG: tetratricopeptide repeat protein [Planctomycetota bacterium]|nr:tetratricopeptide repeat protein [Planctomycetota bacterium]
MGDDEERAAQICRKALEIYPDCVDALHMLADIESQWQRDFVAGVKKAIEAGRRDLGEEYFRENKGHFWGLIETRPFMRAMGALAEALADNEYHLDEAISVHEEMLELNPGDNQGIRYGLLGCYLAKKQYWKAQTLLDQYPDEICAFFLWGRVLLDYATQGEEKAAKTLRNARKENPHVEQYFFPRKQKPRQQPGTYSIGGESEAVICAQLLHVAWKAHSPARKWLQAICSSGQ